MERKCLHCEEIVEGRVDKLFCSAYCKSAYHYQLKKDQGQTLFKSIDQTLKRNRKLLAHYNTAGKSVIRKEVLLKAGFNPNYFTHYWKTQKGDVYLFCYEFGFLGKEEKGKPKYVLVHWQDYMNK
ncbi:MAG: hypothetical protein WDZ35_01105 [Crocinitomicaceae bacterium]